MRIAEGARKVNTQGGGIFVHEDRPKGRETEIQIPNPTRSPLAPIEVRDFVYSKLIHLSPATLYTSALITGDKGLLARGLSEQHLGKYGGLPADSRERDRIARRLLKEIKDHFPRVGSLHGVPGFWEDSEGVHLWKPKDYLLPNLLIPAHDQWGRIQACQMRLPFATMKGLRYLWLSSSDLPHGTGSGGPLHFKFRPTDLPRDALIVIIEGILKADVFSALCPGRYIVGTPSVTANHEDLIELTHGRSALIAFDNDAYKNKSVLFHLVGLIAKRLCRERTLQTTWVASWDAQAKGIDDAALHRLPIRRIGVLTWLNKLSPHFQELAAKRFSDIITALATDDQKRGAQLP